MWITMWITQQIGVKPLDYRHIMRKNGNFKIFEKMVEKNGK